MLVDEEGDNKRYSLRTLCCTCTVQLILLVVVMLAAAYGIRYPVRVAVKDATVARFGLVAGAGPNGTATALAYDLSLTVSVHNPNWAMRAEHAAPLDVDLCFAGRRFDGARLAAAGRSVKPEESDELRLAAVGERALLGSDAVAELVKETTAGQLESLQLKLSGELTYRPVHVGRYKLAVTCPLKLPAAGNSGVVVLDKVIKCH